MSAAAPVRSADGTRRGLLDWSLYVDEFLAARTVLSSSLFPEKPRQMLYGYRYARTAVEQITGWLQERVDGRQFGQSLRVLGSQANGLNLASVLWSYSFANLDATLNGVSIDGDMVEDAYAFWLAAYAAYHAEAAGDALFPVNGGAISNQVLEAESIEQVAGKLNSAPPAGIQRLVAAVTNYSWLLECESRQGNFSHGLYSLPDGTSLFVKEFAGLKGDWYPWSRPNDLALPSTALAIVVHVRDVQARFDAFGVAKLTPEMYGEQIAGVAAYSGGEFIAADQSWLQALQGEIKRAHRGLYESVGGWDSDQRLVAGVWSYGRMYACLIEAAGGTPSDVEALVRHRLSEYTNVNPPASLAAGAESALWSWAGSTTRETIFSPILRELGATEEADTHG